jgi:hypothetical protein
MTRSSRQMPSQRRQTSTQRSPRENCRTWSICSATTRRDYPASHRSMCRQGNDRGQSQNAAHEIPDAADVTMMETRTTAWFQYHLSLPGEVLFPFMLLTATLITQRFFRGIL